MSAILTNLICSIIISLSGLIVVKKISKSEEKIISLKNVILMACLIILPAVTHNLEYQYFYTLISYTMIVITYKYVLNISFSKSILCCAIMYMVICVFDVLNALILTRFLPLNIIRTNEILCIYSNIFVSISTIIIYSIKFISKKISNFIEQIERKKATKFIIFFLLIIVAIVTILYTISLNCKIESLFTQNFLILMIIFLLSIILMSEKENNDKLSLEYENLFNYVKVFEDWIENEQLNRHEYKNQLAVLRCMTKEKKVKDKIDSIISDYINIDSQMINQLKSLPNGGFKGLLYYKIAVAKNQKVNMEVDVSPDVGKILNKLNQDELKILSKLIGIYCDNAIEAAKETRKKIVSLEIYEYDKTANIVISNTFNKKKVPTNRFEKGVSTKGKGHGNGLYFASKMLFKENWIEEKQDIVDNFYIEKLKIKKKPRNKS